MNEFIHFQFAIYYVPSPSGEPLDVLLQLLSESATPLTLTNEVPDKPSSPIVSIQRVNNVQQAYAPPDMQSLQYFGRGLSREQAEKLQTSEQAFIINFAHPKAHVWTGLKTANRIAEALARETGGLLWDEETREIFTPDEWQKNRIEAWTNDVPDISDQTTIHAYNSGEYVRAITLGMSKAGLPDVVVENFPWSRNRTMGHLINLFCQSMAEGATVTKPGQYDLNLAAIQNDAIRDSQTETLHSNATAVALLSLKMGTWEEGDPRNRLVELCFDRYAASDTHARQEKMLSSFFGWEDGITRVKHDELLLAASRNAKAKLMTLRKDFAKGLAPGEFIQVKAPFNTPDGGQEWMWVEITAWDGRKIKGLLLNEPFNIPSLHGGQIVEVDQEDVFDYLRRQPDGSEEGNETSRIIQQMQQADGR